MLLLLPMWWTSAVVSPVSRLLVVMDRPALKLVFDAVFLVGPIAALFAFREHGMNMAVFAYGIAACVAYILYAALLFAASAGGVAEQKSDSGPVRQCAEFSESCRSSRCR